MSVAVWKQSCWSVFGTRAFRCSPHIAHRFRRSLLRFFGAQVHPKAKIRRSVRIGCPWNLSLGELAIVGDHAVLDCTRPISLGARSVVSQLAVLTTQMRDADADGHPVIDAPIQIKDDAWVAADTLVLPGSVVSEGTVIGARGLVERTTTEPWHICVGHPVRAIKERPYPNRTPMIESAAIDSTQGATR